MSEVKEVDLKADERVGYFTKASDDRLATLLATAAVELTPWLLDQTREFPSINAALPAFLNEAAIRLRTRPASTGKGEGWRADREEEIGPRPAKYVCKGCPAYETEDWHEPSGDGETYDTGRYGWCRAAGRKSMGAYHYDHNNAPDWCPALVSTSQGVGVDLESTSQSLRSAPSFALPEQWRDISTAPKDGSAIDLWVDWPEFDNGFGVSPAHGSRWPAARWVDGDWYDGQFSLHQYSAKPSALHWMPMPSPPKSHAEEG
jgi:hypothetical protein